MILHFFQWLCSLLENNLLCNFGCIAGSSDEEVCGLTTGPRPPVQFRTSPPLEVHKPLRSVSPPTKVLSLANSGREGMSSSGGGETSGSPGVGGSDGGTARAEGGARAASPRKRHRQTPRPHQMHRPCLDFEKMQQVIINAKLG